MLVGQRTQISNTIRGLVGEFGITIRKGLEHIRSFAEDMDSEAHTSLPPIAQDVIKSLSEHLLALHARVVDLDKEIAASAKRIIVSSCCKPSQALAQSMRPLLSPRLAVHISLKAGVTLRLG